GEEFTVILPNTDGAGAVVMAERLRNAIASAPWTHRSITASFGAATFNNVVDTGEKLIAEADRALYTSKEKGRNTVTHAQYGAARRNEQDE
ncbi:MAG: GGDEF domain-containing protein, partial [Armatimonadota bacterium]|nr:GGDEF domain-containing protein [Armatimonadota bacterium]